MFMDMYVCIQTLCVYDMCMYIYIYDVCTYCLQHTHTEQKSGAGCAGDASGKARACPSCGLSGGKSRAAATHVADIRSKGSNARQPASNRYHASLSSTKLELRVLMGPK